MNRPAVSARGFTLVEVLVATALTLMLMAAVVTMFGSIGDSIDTSRSVLESSDRVRAAATRLQRDLEGVTVTMMPPRRPEADEGYFELIEGPVGVAYQPWDVAVNPDSADGRDTTVGDFDDRLMFTTRSTTGRPFSGRFAAGGSTVQVLQSDVAEVAWFVRGRTLYRRELLVVGGLDLSGHNAQGFYARNDVSVRLQGNQLMANTLGDLTKRENRFAHDVRQGHDSFPFDARGWGQLGLPTLRECSSPGWVAGRSDALAQVPAAAGQFDFWSNDPSRYHPWSGVDPETGAMNSYAGGTRLVEDVILTNVIGFDVKVWDNTAGTYVDLGYQNAPYQQGASGFGHLGHPQSGLAANQSGPRVYCTWSFHYEHDGIRQPSAQIPGVTDAGTNGFDDSGNGVIDSPDEWETSPPYPTPLRGIQVKIRVFEPDSRQVREVTVLQDFLPR